MSAIRSLGSSIPTDSLNKSSGTELSKPSTVERCSIRLSTPPRLSAKENIFVFSKKLSKFLIDSLENLIFLNFSY